MPQIKCSVTECNYNKDVMCHASMIQVERNGVNKADMSTHTKCETFKPKD